MNTKNKFALWRDDFSPLDDFRRDLGRLFEDWTVPTSGAAPTHLGFVPACDVVEERDHFLLTVELAGVNRDDLKIETVDHRLIISGERRSPYGRNDDAFGYSERQFGKFERAFSLPPEINPDQIEAEHHDGVLRIVVPKAEESKPRQIKISGGGSRLFSKFLGQPKETQGQKEKEVRNSIQTSDQVAS